MYRYKIYKVYLHIFYVDGTSYVTYVTVTQWRVVLVYGVDWPKSLKGTQMTQRLAQNSSLCAEHTHGVLGFLAWSNT